MPTQAQNGGGGIAPTLALEGRGRSASRAGCFIPGKDPGSIVQDAGRASGPVWSGKGNLNPTGIRSLNVPARDESLIDLNT
jgi:hypothetical protein